MSLEKKIEKRRRQVQELILMGYTYNEIADKLKVSPPTIVEDVKALNKRYEKLVVENEDYLTKQIQHIFELQDEFNLIKKTLWEIIKESDTKKRDKVTALGNLIKYMSHKAKILNLIQVDKVTFNNTYIKIEQVKPILERVIYIIKKYVKEDNQVGALEELRRLNISGKNGEK